ncbi:hypothetical protein [Mycolicibacterium austroafricanum]|uniref:hypothetical protein n=1 Tax=Mycolicibacterium austroafricanum TaxID=39687 RepID=UPI001ABF0D2C|nr:hypothetical protein [Mycolicibacterium austroafricanum]QRZ05879.1 hypothetical protein JN090_23615 [Mycolicibacterium austroafricanum]
MTVTITGSVKDVTGVADNEAPWMFASVIRFADDGSVITETPREVRPVAGNIKVELEPGYAIVTYGKHVWPVDVPTTPTTLKALIEAGVAFPPDTAQTLLDAAVGAYVEANRQQFRSYAVPVEGDPGMVQWYDANDVAIGVPVPGVDVLDFTNYYVRFVDQNGDPLPVGSLTTIHVNTLTGEIDDITFEGA